MKSRPIHLLLLRQSLKARNAPLPRYLPAATLIPSSTSRLLPVGASSFHSSASRLNEPQRPIQSPWRVFVDTLAAEFKKNQALQEDVKQLQGDVDKLADSQAMKKAKELYMRTKIIQEIKENPKLRAAAEALQAQGLKVSDAVGEAMKVVEDSEFMRSLAKASAAVSAAAAATTAPVRNTAAYKALSDGVIEAFEEGSRYGGYENKEARKLRREKRAERLERRDAGKPKKERVKINPDAGEALVLSDKPTPKKWSSGLSSSPAFVKFSEAWEESENPVVSTLRSVTYRVQGLFEENETAKVTRMIRELDPEFQMEAFQKELREYIIPEVVDAYIHADRESLKMWCGEAAYNVLWATLEQFTKKGLISDSKVLDIRHVDVAQGKILDNDIPTFIVSFATQEIIVWRSAKTGEIVQGTEDGVEQVRYGAVISKIEAELENEETNGWKILQLARSGARGYL